MSDFKLVTLTLEPITLVVTGNNNAQLLANAKKKLIKQLTQEVECTFGIKRAADTLTLSTAFPGLIVESNEEQIGIVTEVNAENIHVTLKNHIIVTGPPNLFKVSSASFEEARSKRSKIEGIFWEKGYTGYIQTNEGIREVIVGETYSHMIKLFIINGRKSITLNEQQIKIFLKDELVELKPTF